MNILITGAKGFIGKHLVKRLSKNHSVTEHEWGDQLPDLWHYKAVIHTGAISSTTYTDVEQILKQNYEFTTDLIQKATEDHCNFHLCYFARAKPCLKHQSLIHSKPLETFYP